MKIWVDADACPTVIKEILFRAAERTQTVTTLVANHAMRIPPSKFISRIQVSSGFDIADNEIVKNSVLKVSYPRFGNIICLPKSLCPHGTYAYFVIVQLA